MTGVTGIPDDVFERAVEAAAKADYEVLYSNPDRRNPWDEQSDDFRDAYRSDVRPLVTAALAEVAPDLAAANAEIERLRSERGDLAKRLSVLLCELTGGRMSKTNYDVRTMVAEIDAAYDEYAQQERAEVEALRAAVARVEALADNAQPIPIHVGGGNLVSRRKMVHVDDLREALRGDES